MEHYLDEMRELLQSLKYEYVENQTPNIEYWFATNETPRLPWENYHDDDMFVRLPLKTEAPDFYRILLGSMVFLHRHYAWCSPETTQLALRFWNDHNQ